MYNADNYNQGFLQLRSGLTIYPSQDRAIDAILRELIEKSPARFVMLTDISGQIISVQGDRSRVSEPIALGSLIAGDLAASREIARLLGEYQSHQLVLREGETSHTFIVESGPYMVLFTQVEREVPLGWARMVIRQAAERLAKVVDELPEELQNSPQVNKKPSATPLHNTPNITDQFGEALDALWTEEE